MMITKETLLSMMLKLDPIRDDNGALLGLRVTTPTNSMTIDREAAMALREKLSEILTEGDRKTPEQPEVEVEDSKPKATAMRGRKSK